MGLWHVLAACAAAWISGAFFGLGILEWLAKRKPAKIGGEAAATSGPAVKVQGAVTSAASARGRGPSKPQKLFALSGSWRLYRSMVRDAGHWLQLWIAVLLLVAACWAIVVVTVVG